MADAEKRMEPSDQARAMVAHVQERVRARHAELCKAQDTEAVFLSNRSVSKTMKEVQGLEDHLSRMRHSRQVRGGHKIMVGIHTFIHTHTHTHTHTHHTHTHTHTHTSQDEWSHQEGTRAQLLDFHSKKGNIVV